MCGMGLARERVFSYGQQGAAMNPPPSRFGLSLVALHDLLLHVTRPQPLPRWLVSRGPPSLLMELAVLRWRGVCRFPFA